MRLNEFSSQLNKFLATVKVHGTSVKTLIHAESQSHARLLLGKMFGNDNVVSINSVNTNESKTVDSDLYEAVNTEDLLELWQLVSQNMFQAIERKRREAIEAERIEASKPKKNRAVRSSSRSVNAVKAPTVKAVRPKTVRPKAVKPQVPKSQASKTQAAASKSVSKQQSPQMTQVARPQTQTQARPQQTMMPRSGTIQPTLRTPQASQLITQQQQLAQVNRKLNHNGFPV